MNQPIVPGLKPEGTESHASRYIPPLLAQAPIVGDLFGKLECIEIIGFPRFY